MELGFNPQEYDIPTGLEPIRPDWYQAVIAKFTMKATKANDGQVLEVQLVIDESAHPEAGGRHLYERLNIHNKNEVAQRIGRGSMRKIQECVGRAQSTNTDDLVGLKLMVKVGRQEATEQYKARNVIQDYKPIGSVQMAGAGAAATGAPVSSPNTVAPSGAPATKPAWLRQP